MGLRPGLRPDWEFPVSTGLDLPIHAVAWAAGDLLTSDQPYRDLGPDHFDRLTPDDLDRRMIRRLLSRVADREDYVSDAWLRQQDRRDMRIEFEGVRWNWSYLITKYRRQQWQQRTRARSRVA